MTCLMSKAVPTLFWTKENENRFLNPWKQILFIAFAFVFSFFAYIFLKPHADLMQYGWFIKLIMIGLMLLNGTLFFFYHPKQKTMDDYLLFFLVEAFFFHLMYMLYTDGSIRQHDVWTGKQMDGHEGYAYSFYENMALPNHHNTPDTAYQFYHPPFNAFLQGSFMRFFEKVCFNGALLKDEATLYKSCQILSVTYTSISTLFLVKTIKVTDLEDRFKLLSGIFVCLYPCFIFESGELNNDNLSMVFQSMALYYFFRWYLEKKSYRNILPCGLFVGLAMASKMSAASICLGMAIGFIVQAVRSLLKKEDSIPFFKLFLQYLCFLLICAPIGLWYQVYAHVALGFPFNFVFNNLNSALFNGPRSWVLEHKMDSIAYYDSNNSGILYENAFLNFVVRFLLPFYIPDFFSMLGFASPWEYYSIQTYALKTSIFGEYNYSPLALSNGFAFVSYFFLEVLWLMTIVYLFYILIHHKTLKMGKEGRMMLVLAFGLMVMLGYLCYTMPFGCSMDFRYIMPFVLPAGYLFGKMNQTMVNRETKFNHVYQNIYFSFGALFFISCGLFFVISY